MRRLHRAIVPKFHSPRASARTGPARNFRTLELSHVVAGQNTCYGKLLTDGFTFNAVSWLEALGFCEPGGARDFIDAGRGIALDGPLPVNPHGGQLSAGRLHGFGHVREAML